jgi:hypothetical protein
MKSKVSDRFWEVLFSHSIIKGDITGTALLNYQTCLVIFFSLIMETFLHYSDLTNNH